MTPVGVARRIGIVCLMLALLCLAPALPLHCLGPAVRVGGFGLLDGALLGTALAMITRTRRPLWIYTWLAVAALTLWLVYEGWPPAGPWEIHPWPGAPDIVYNYLDVLRSVLFILGLPYPFARLGYHAPDPLPPPEPSDSPDDS